LTVHGRARPAVVGPLRKLKPTIQPRWLVHAPTLFFGSLVRGSRLFSRPKGRKNKVGT
jgi:hypothetical protein